MNAFPPAPEAPPLNPKVLAATVAAEIHKLPRHEKEGVFVLGVAHELQALSRPQPLADHPWVQTPAAVLALLTCMLTSCMASPDGETGAARLLAWLIVITFGLIGWGLALLFWPAPPRPRTPRTLLTDTRECLAHAHWKTACIRQKARAAANTLPPHDGQL